MEQSSKDKTAVHLATNGSLEPDQHEDGQTAANGHNTSDLKPSGSRGQLDLEEAGKTVNSCSSSSSNNLLVLEGNKMLQPAHRQSKSLDDTNCIGSRSPNQLGAPRDKRSARRGSTCQMVHGIPTIVQTPAFINERQYIVKENLSEEEKMKNEKVFREVMAAEFPDEDMVDKKYRDKDKDLVIKMWILDVLEEVEDNPKSKAKKLQATEEFEFYLQSGVVLCNLAAKIVPGFQVDKEKLQSNNLFSRRSNIAKFLAAVSKYGVPDDFLFSPDDLATLGHVHKVTRTLFAFGEMTKQDPNYAGPGFDHEKILADLVTHGIRRKSSCRDVEQVNTSIHSIFANLMQDVQRKNSLTPKGPPKNIYSS